MKNLIILIGVTTILLTRSNAQQNILYAQINEKHESEIALNKNESAQIAGELYPAASFPFNQTGFINYEIRLPFKNASLLFLDERGHMVKEIQIEETGPGAITIFAGDLPIGKYSYSLSIDGGIIQTQKLLVSDQ